MTDPLQLNSAGNGIPSSSHGREISRTPPTTADTEYTALLQDILIHDIPDVPLLAYDAKKLVSSAKTLQDPRIIDLLEAAGGNLRMPITTDGVTLLHWAVLHGKEEMVQILLARGLEVDTPTYDGRTPLHFAALSGRLKIFDLLISHGADPLALTKMGVPPLMFAARGRSHAVIERIISMGADINMPVSPEGMTVVHLAARDGIWSAIEVLLQYGADLNLPDTNGHTPLWYAMQNGHGAVVELLLAHGADENTVLESQKPVEAMQHGFIPAWVTELFYVEERTGEKKPPRFLYGVAISLILIVAACIHGCHR